jgi:peroxiredoxin
MSRVRTGDQADNFSLKNQNETLIDTAAMGESRILLSFHPLAWTDICAKQMLSLEEHIEEFRKLNTVPLGLSVDTVPSKKAWAKSLGIEKTDLLADFWPHGAIAARLGLFLDKFGFSERANIILDGQRKVIFAKVYPIKELPDIQEILSFLK